MEVNSHTNLRWNYNDEEIRKKADDLIAFGENALNKIGSIPKDEVTWENSFIAFSDMESYIATQSADINFLSNCSPEKSVRDASNEVKKKLADFSVDAYMREDVFLVLKAYSEKVERDKINVEEIDRRLMNHTLRDFVRKGLELPTEKRERFKEIQKSMISLQVSASQNMNEENSTFVFTRSELEGMEEDFLSSRKIKSEGEQVKEGEEEEKYKISLKYPDYFPVMKHCVVGIDRIVFSCIYFLICYFYFHH